MLEVLSIGIPILIVDVTNPVLLAAVVLSLTTGRPVLTALAVILGHTAAYFLAGFLILYGLNDFLLPYLEQVLSWFSNPTSLDFAISGLVGAVLALLAVRWKVSPPKPSENEPEQITVGLFQAFLFGGLLSFVGIPFAVPYFGFLGNLFRLDSGTQQLVALVAYNLFYALPFLLFPLALIAFGDAIMPAIRRINEAVEKYAAYVMPVMIGLLGLALLADAFSYFLTGHGLV